MAISRSTDLHNMLASTVRAALWGGLGPLGVVLLMGVAECETDILWQENHGALAFLFTLVALAMISGYFWLSEKSSWDASIAKWVTVPCTLLAFLLFFALCAWRCSAVIVSEGAAPLPQDWSLGWEYKMRERFLLPRAQAIFGENLGRYLCWHFPHDPSFKNIAFGGKKSSIIADPEPQPSWLADHTIGEPGTFSIFSIFPPDTPLINTVLTVTGVGSRNGFGTLITLQNGNVSYVKNVRSSGYEVTLVVPESVTSPVVVRGTITVPVEYAKLTAPGSEKFTVSEANATARCEALLVPKSYDAAQISQFFADNDDLGFDVCVETLLVSILVILAVGAVAHISKMPRKRVAGTY